MFRHVPTSPALLALCAAVTACAGETVSNVVVAEPASTSAQALAPQGAWPAWQRDASRRGAGASLITADGQVRWQLPLGAAARGSPVVASDGTILVVTQNALVAARADGTERWRVTLDATGLRTSAVVGDDGSVYVADRTRVRKILLSNGAVAWNVAAGCPAQHALNLINTAVLVPTTCGLRALNPSNGALLWSFISMTDVSAAAVMADGSVLLSDVNGTIHNLNSAGATRWSAPLGVEVSAPTVLADGRVATLGADGQVYLLDASGNFDNVLPAVTDVCGSPVRALAVSQAPDGSLRVMGCDAFPFGGVVVVALNLDGTERYRTPLGIQLDGNTASVGADGNTVISTMDGFAARLDANGQPSWVAATGPTMGAPAVAADGVVYVADQNGTLTALGLQCTPQCLNRACGSDLCGGSCGACNTPPQCFAGPGLCDATSGTCSYPNTLDGTSCTDGFGCSQGDICQGGTCIPGPAPCVDGNTCTVDDCAPDLTQFTTSTTPLEDISAFGTTTVDGDDAITGPIPLGFTLDFFGVPVDTVFISTNGFVGLDGVDAFSNTSFPDPFQPNGMLAAFWDDLSANPGAVRFARLGSPPARRFIAQWTNVQLLNNPGTNLTFQVVIQEATQGVEFRYARLAGLPRNRATGSGATVGIESLDGSQAALFSFNRASLQVGRTLVWNREAFVCSNPPEPPGSPCDDGTMCTQGDTCVGSTCQGAPITCAPPGECEDTGTCNPFTGACVYPPLPDGTACNVANACLSGACQGGACVGSTPVVCPPPPNACLVSTCDPMTGTCTLFPAGPGGACDDLDPCTFGDACDGNGGCVGTAYTCSSGTCESLAACDGLGGCTVTPLPDGTPCADNQGCTQGDVCIGGTCTAGPPPVCPNGNGCSSASCVPDDLGRFTVGATPMEDISAVGTPSISGDDALSNPVPLGFTFRFLGMDHTTVRLSTNGYITFGAQDTYVNEPIPRPGIVNGFLAPFWDDLLVNPGQLVFATVGQAPHQRFIAQWSGLDVFGATLCNLTFQVVLTNGTNAVEFRYGALSCGNPSVAQGGSATVGVESLDGRSGLQFSFNQPQVRPFTSITWDREVFTCSSNPLPDGTMCTDGDACTTGDQCRMGNCTPNTTTVCNAPGQCLAAQCDPASGACLVTPVPDGTPCLGGACFMGACIPGADGGVLPDAGTQVDAGRVDAGRPDAGGPDAGRPDAGRPDAGGGVDAGGPDAGTMFDAGTRPDSGIVVDAGRVDSGTNVDAGTRPDSGTTVDSGIILDAGTRPDSGTTVDAGTRPDSGTTVDAGTRPDSGTTTDGGTVVDSGTRPDSGTNMDAGTTVDASTRPDAAVTGDGGTTADASMNVDAGPPPDAAGLDAAVLQDAAVLMDGSMASDAADLRDAARDADGNIIAVDAGGSVHTVDPPPFVYVNGGGCSHASVDNNRAPWLALALLFLLRRRRR